MDRHETEQLLERYRAGTCTATERRLVEAWFNRELSESQLDAEPDWEAVKATIWHRLRPRTSQPKRLRRLLPYAAAVVIATTVVTWVFFGDTIRRPSKTIAIQDIAPGGHRATLTLADGRTIDLSDTQTGIVVGDRITYLDGSKISEKANGAFMSLTTPKGGTYQITLPDGSTVWLNAGSTLKYPSRFDNNERVVELEGEAYFDVARNGKIADSQRRTTTALPGWPFRVVSAGQTIEVLGTEFNVSAYADEAEIKTTLVKGSVRISPFAAHSSPIIIQPGEQVIARDGNFDKIKVDVAAATAWKSGKFNFDGKSFRQVMNEVSRWYDLEVVYDGTEPGGQLVGDAYRNQNLSIVLGMLDVLEIDYKLDVSKRKLTIYGTKGGSR